ncbi:MAG: undecaprenyldiphospho-muramoylpentapeptide beta-N-acetylglucosaminyltransferase [Lachnospiraceae bacterium]|jgi:UDP-N-acetylglucosamine--N-acetylmuramyl-(pentapeptide) pyrophosphoryl-undecaprenol N-acetylglucosamine transferase
MPKILLTGGGTAGHVTPNLALIPYLKEEGFEIEYMGSYDGIERRLVEQEGIPYTGIATGKLRRYLSVENLKDPFRVLKGIKEAKKYMKEQRPDVVFSKGGFVVVPVVFAAKAHKIPIVIHESDMSPGLANKLCIRMADKICYNFPESAEYLQKEKAIHTGLPIRDELFNGSKEKGLIICNFSDGKPVLMVVGGSLGATCINDAVRNALPELLQHFQIVHICGEGKLSEALNSTRGYRQFEYVNEDLSHLMAMSDCMISRAGANVLCEIHALAKPALLIPLGTQASRGDQILNAQSFEKRGFAKVLPEERMTKERLVTAILEVYENREKYAEAMRRCSGENAARRIAGILSACVKERQEN